MIKGFPDDWVAAQVALGHLIGPAHQQIEGEAGWTGLANRADLGQMPALEWHHHEDVGIRIPAPFTAGLGSKQNDLLRSKPFHQLLREGLQGLAGDERTRGRHDHVHILTRNAGSTHEVEALRVIADHYR